MVPVVADGSLKLCLNGYWNIRSKIDKIGIRYENK